MTLIGKRISLETLEISWHFRIEKQTRYLPFIVIFIHISIHQFVRSPFDN